MDKLNRIFYSNLFISYLLCSLIIGSFFFAQSFGLKALFPSNNDWLMHGDWAQCYLGWEFFRNSPFQLPLGSAPDLFYPHGSNITYTDSVPWFSILMKPISQLFKGDFQHLGLWFLTCFILQFFFSFLIVKEFKLRSALMELLVATTLFASPIFFQRFDHATLSSHWLVLACIWNYIRRNEKHGFKIQTAINVMAAFTNPYFCVFAGVASVAFVAKKILTHSVPFPKVFKFIGLQGILILSIWALMGYFSISQKNVVDTGTALGIYSANINSFWNPVWGTSNLLQPIQLHHVQQYEGYGYFGFGILILVCILSLAFLINKKIQNILYPRISSLSITPLLIACLMLYVYALSQKITLFDWTVLEFKDNFLVKDYLSIFRSSGRFIWLIVYCISAFCLYCIHLLVQNKTLKAIAFSIILSLQLFDIYDTLIIRYRVPEDSNKHSSKLSNPTWDAIFDNCKTIVPFPSHQRTILNEEDYTHFLYRSLKNHNNIATGYLARFDNSIVASFNSKMLENLQQATIDENTAIITTADHLHEIEPTLANGKKAVSFWLDGYLIIVNANNNLVKKLDLKPEIHPKHPALKHLIEQNHDRFIVIAGKDEATANLSAEDKAYLTKIGGNLDKLGFRGSYCAVVFNERVYFEGLQNSHPASLDLPSGTLLGGTALPKNLQIISEGKAANPDNDKAVILVDGVDYSKNKRGFNTAIFDNNMNLLSNNYFDTFMYGYTFDLPNLTSKQ